MKLERKAIYFSSHVLIEFIFKLGTGSFSLLFEFIFKLATGKQVSKLDLDVASFSSFERTRFFFVEPSITGKNDMGIKHVEATCCAFRT